MDEASALDGISALSNRLRLRVVLLLAREGDGLASGALATAVGVPRPLMSNHLAVLAAAGLVRAGTRDGADGRAVVYRVERQRLEALADFIRDAASE